jgi:hypothetical protein
LEELEERSVPALLGLLGGSSPGQPTGGILGVVGSTLSTVTLLVDRAVVAVDQRAVAPVLNTVAIDLIPTQPLPPPAAQPLSASVSAAPGDGVAALLTLQASVASDTPLVQVSTAGPIVPTSLAVPGSLRTVVPAPEPLTVTGTGLTAAAVVPDTVSLPTVQASVAPPVRPPTVGPSSFLPSGANAVAQTKTAGTAAEGTAIQRGTAGAEPTTALAAAAVSQAAAGSSITPALPPVQDQSGVLFVVGGTRLPEAAVGQQPTQEVQSQPAGATAVTGSPQRTLPAPAGVEEEVDPLPGEAPDLIDSCPSQLPPALDLLMRDFAERIGTARLHWMEWTPWLALLTAGGAAYALGRRRRKDGTFALPLRAETLSL